MQISRVDGTKKKQANALRCDGDEINGQECLKKKTKPEN